MRCPLKEGWCAKPTQCRSCPYFSGGAGKVVWLCSTCIHNNSSLPFYHKGSCDRCGEFRAVLMPVPTPGLCQELPEEEEPPEGAS